MAVGTVKRRGLNDRRFSTFNPNPVDETTGLPTTNTWTRNPSWSALPSVTSTEHKFVGLHAVRSDAEFLALTLTNTAPSNKLSAGTTTDAATFTTASATFVAKRLYLLTIENSHGTSASEISSITGGTGVPTFIVRATTLFNSNLNRITLLSVIPTSNYTGTLTINFGGTTQTGVVWNLSEFVGVDNTTNDGIVQTVTATGNSTTPSVTLSAFSNAAYATFGAIANVASGIVAGSGYTAIGNTVIGSPTQCLACQWRADNDTTVDATATTGEWAIIGVELAIKTSTTYSVNWGDGVTETVNSGTTAYHQYSFSDGDLANTDAPVTLTDSGDLVTRTAHGYTDGMTVRFYNIVTTTGLTEGELYYVINSTANTFQVSETKGGSAVTLTSNGSATLLPYKQAIVTVTTTGLNFTTLNLNVIHNQANLQAYSSGWLDMRISGPNLTSLTIGGTTVYHTILEQVELVNQNLTVFSSLFRSCFSLESVPFFNVRTDSPIDMSGMFNSCYSIKTIPLLDTSQVTSMGSMFNNCRSLQTVPQFNTGNVTDMSSMFDSCYVLESIPYFNTSKVIDMSSMFRLCKQLETVPLFDTSQVTAMTSMFLFCAALKTVPLFDTSNVTNMSNMFNSCDALETVPLFNTVKVTNMSSMFANSPSLRTVPLFNTSNVTTMASMFGTCTSLSAVPLFDTSKVTTMASMFQTCSALQRVPKFNTSAATLMNLMFSSCTSLKEVPNFNTANVTNSSSVFNACYSLTSAPALSFASATSTGGEFLSCYSLISSSVTGMRYAHSYGNCKLSKSALETIFTNLDTVVGTPAITITGNWGVDTAVTKTVNTTAQSATVSMANTSGLSVGMLVTGGGMGMNGRTVTADITADTLTLNNHGLTNGTPVSFSSLGTVTGVSINTIYYVVSTATNTFKVAATLGGAAIDLTGTNATVIIRYANYISSISTNVSITLSQRAANTQTNTTLTFRSLDSAQALHKGWTVTY